MTKKDKKVSNAMELRRVLLGKKTELLGTETPQYKTNGVFRPRNDSQAHAIDLKTASQSGVINAYKSILNHSQAITELDIISTHLGFTVDEWKDDMKLRIKVLNRSATLRKIHEIETNLRTMLTPAELREIGVAELTAEIDKL